MWTVAVKGLDLEAAAKPRAATSRVASWSTHLMTCIYEYFCVAVAWLIAKRTAVEEAYSAYKAQWPVKTAKNENGNCKGTFFLVIVLIHYLIELFMIIEIIDM